ncbi:MAG: flagellar hook-length control protein FliK [Thermodesulfobacteriota bacterium]
MLTAFGPNPATLFLSWRGGARAAAPPRQDDFREVFQSRLLSRLSAQKRAAQAAASRGGSGDNRVRNRPEAKAGESGVGAAFRSAETRRAAGAEVSKRRPEAPQTRRQDESQATAPGLAAQASQSAGGPQAQPQGANGANPPQALQDLITFLQALPNGAMQIPPEKIQAVAAYLLNAGLPQEEVQGLLLSPDLAEQGLSAQDLQAAWQRTQGQAASAEIVPQPGAPSTAPQSQPGLNLSPETQEMLQSQGHRARWERSLVPESAVPALRLALARLGCSPQDLARLEEEAQGQGLSLKRVWQVLQQAQHPVGQTAAVSPHNQPGAGVNFTPASLLAERPVSGEEIAQWRQLLLEAGVGPEAVDKMLGQQAPNNQEALKTTLLALAPPEEPAEALTDPKPLYLPHNLRLRPLFPQAQGGWDQSQLFGEGNADQQNFGAPGQWAATNGEAFVLPAITGELPMFNANLTGAAALSSTGSLWNPVAPEVRDSVWSQLQSGIISNLQPGENQVTLRLNPPEMGQIQLTLQLSGQDLAVTAVASRPEVAELATQGVQQLLQALAQQGLVLTHFQVRLQDQPQVLTTTNLAGGRDKSSGESGEKPSTFARRHSGEVDRFV